MSNVGDCGPKGQTFTSSSPTLCSALPKDWRYRERTKAHMAVLKVRIADDLAAKFAEAYPGRGDRSVILRRAVQSLVDGKVGTSEGKKAKLGPPPSRDLMQKSPKGRNRSLQYGRTVPVSVRLTPEQYTGIEDQALRLGVSFQ